jgi:Holliday junction resolvase
LLTKTDINHVQISDAFRKLGYSVFDTSAVGRGFPDIIIAKNNNNYMIEIKSDKGKLNPKQIEFQNKWYAVIYIVHNTYEVIKVHNQISKRT